MNNSIIQICNKNLVTLLILITTVINLSYSHNIYANNVNDAHAYSTFDQSNSHDIETAVLAVTRGQSEAVRMIGNMIINDHVPLLKKIRKMADTKGISYLKNYANERATAHKATMNYLLDKNNEEFDKAYLDYELKFSQDFIKTLKDTIIPNTQNTEFKVFFTDTLSTFEEHLSHIDHAVIMLKPTNVQTDEDNHANTHQHKKHK